MKKLPNINTTLALVGIAATFAPDISSIAAWLASSGVEWLSPVARVLGVLALLLTSAPRVIKRLRPMLAAAGLATPHDQVQGQDTAVTKPEKVR